MGLTYLRGDAVSMIETPGSFAGTPERPGADLLSEMLRTVRTVIVDEEYPAKRVR